MTAAAPTELPNLLPAIPEMFLAAAALALLMFGAFRGDRSTRLVGQLAVLVLACTAALVWRMGDGRVVTFNGLFVLDDFAVYAKTLILLGSAVTLFMSLFYLYKERMARFEFPVMILFATLGMMMMVSANDLMALYLGLETASLSFYVLAAFRRDNAKSSEAGLKYFVLGALSSGLLLYGASLIYGYAGVTQFDALMATLGDGTTVPTGVVIGLVFVAAALIFKVSAVPFHMWTPDVYEGAPTAVTAFFATAPKIAAMSLLLRVLNEPFGDMTEQWRQIILFVAVASMVLGAFAAIAQTNIKRLMAYSAIGHVGFALVGLSSGTQDGVQAVLVYLTVYVVMSAGTFGVILCMRQHGRMVEDINQLAGLSRTHPLMALAMAIFMFSMAGIPPLAGFFGKLYVFLAAIEAGLLWVAVIGVLCSVVGAYYYIRIVKLMYFDEAVESFEPQTDDGMTAVLAGSAVVTLLFFLILVPVVEGAGRAAASLAGGG